MVCHEFHELARIIFLAIQISVIREIRGRKKFWQMTTLNDLHSISSTFSNTDKMPVLFLGHGSPMNAIEENQFVAGFRNLAKTLP